MKWISDNTLKRAIFFDRDGVLNSKAKDGGYIKSPEEFEFLPFAKESIKMLARTDFMLIVVTNQRGIAKGVMSVADLNSIHYHMCKELKKAGGRIDHIFYCPHDIETNCNCRKPRTGMLLEARSELGINLNESYLVGDSMTDIEAGVGAECKETILIDASCDAHRASHPIRPDRCVANVYESASYILERL